MDEKQNGWWLFNGIEELDSPALLIYPDRVKKNIDTAIKMAADPKKLRPHIKTNKSEDASRLMINAGIQKFKCATIAEAEMLGLVGAADVLLAYQPVGPKLKRLIGLIKKFPATTFSCLADHPLAASQMSETFAKEKISVPIYIDLNIGQNRTGITPGDSMIELYLTCSKLKGIQPVGLHAYDGHIRDMDWNLRKKNCDAAFSLIEKMREAIQSKGLPSPKIIAGGSPTFSIHCSRPDIECSPGTFVYWDKGYLDLCPEQEFLPAALVLTRVISKPGSSSICLDLGHKSVAAENEISRRVYFPGAPELKPTGQSEEHLVLQTDGKRDWPIGETLFGIPYHICPTVALYERAYT
ncbi:MAG: D-TA family PLP-dependent enzyme, partial [Chitinophagales bacterium]